MDNITVAQPQHGIKNTNGFSGHRFMMVVRYYISRMKWFFVICLLISIALLILADLAGLEDGDAMAGAVIGLLSYLAGLAPLKYAKRENLEISLTLPAKGAEKFLAVMLISFIVVPVLVYGPVFLGSWIMYGSPYYNFILEDNEVARRLLSSDWQIFYSIAAFIAGISSCLWGVFASRRLKVLYGVIGYFAIPVTLFLAGVIWGVICAFRIMSDVETGVADDIDPIQLIDMSAPLFKWLASGLVIYAIFALTKTWRAICRKQI